MTEIDALKTEIGLLNQVIECLEGKLGETGKALLETRIELEKSYKTKQNLINELQIDVLTELQGRRKFEEFYEKEYARAKRYGQMFSIIMLDADDFKKINDTHGHKTGDDVLKFIGGVIKARLRDADLGARWGGEEYMIVLPNTDVFHASQVAERIRTEIEGHDFGSFKITVSLGISQFSNMLTADELLKKVDAALYASKRNGKNKITIL